VALLVALAIYWPTTGYPFLYDDHRYIEENPALRSPMGLISGFWTPFPPHQPEMGVYRPLFTTTLTLDYLMASPIGRASVTTGLPQVSPVGFHRTNLVLHLLATLLVGLLARALLAGKVPDWVPAAAALLFAVHPVHIEAVANVTGRAEVQTAVFYLAGLLCLCHHSMRARLVDSPFLWGAAACFAGALFTKESGVTFPLAAAGVLWLRSGQTDSEEEQAGAPRGGASHLVAIAGPLLLFGAVFALYLAGRVYALPELLPSGQYSYFQVYDDLPPGPSMAMVGILYATLLVFPVAFNPDYGFPLHYFGRLLVGVPSGWENPFALIGLALALAVVVVAAVALWRRSVWAVGLLLLVAPLAVYAGIIPFGDLAAERFLYLPSAGWCILIACLLPRLRLAPVISGVLTVLVLGWGFWTVANLPMWSSNEALSKAMIAASPGNDDGWFALGQHLHQEAFQLRTELQAELRRNPPANDTMSPRANELANAMKARYDRAEIALREAARLNEKSTGPRLSLMQLLLEGPEQRPAEVWEIYRHLVKHAFDKLPYPGLWHRVSNAAALQGNYRTALRHLQAARHVRKLAPDEAAKHYDITEALYLYEMGAKLFNDGKKKEGLLLTRRATQLDNNILYARNLAIMLEDTGNLKPALDQWSYLATREPSNPEYRRSVARVAKRIETAAPVGSTVPPEAPAESPAQPVAPEETPLAPTPTPEAPGAP